MAASRDRIVEFCKHFLNVSDFRDWCSNGLQVEGAPQVKRIAAGVSLSIRLIEEAVAKGADTLLVHHGLFGKDLEGPAVQGITRRRLKLLLEHDMNLLGFHLPLDAHPRIGNNIGLCKLLGVAKRKPLDVGFQGELARAVRLPRWVATIDQKLRTKSQVLASGPKLVKRVAVISGGASPSFQMAASAGCDTLLCGDLRENVVRGAEELHLNVINAGHYNTEKLGVINLSRLLAQRFGVQAEFIDVPCEI